MAGETPGANKANKQRKRKKLNWRDDRSTNKIYASGDISALGNNQTVADSVLKPGQMPTPIPTPKVRPDDKSADKYYDNRGSQRTRVAGQKKQAPQPPVRSGRQAKAPLPSAAGAVIRDKGHIGPILDALVEKLTDGATKLVVYIAAGNSDLLRRTRTRLEQMVAQEKISEEQYHEVRLSYEPASTQPPPQPSETKAVTDIGMVDPMAFLAGEGADEMDPPVDTSPLPTVEHTGPNPFKGEVVVEGDGVALIGGDLEGLVDKNDDDSDDNDFLTPKVEVSEALTETQPLQDAAVESDGSKFGAAVEDAVKKAETTEESKADSDELRPEYDLDKLKPAPEGKRRGKRSGRGSD